MALTTLESSIEERGWDWNQRLYAYTIELRQKKKSNKTKQKQPQKNPKNKTKNGKIGTRRRSRALDHRDQTDVIHDADNV